MRVCKLCLVFFFWYFSGYFGMKRGSWIRRNKTGRRMDGINN